ncbi:hypothetical protein FDB34_13380 [Clostridium botulinum]|nr:hypothetical protein [Clostridium botulinum]
MSLGGFAGKLFEVSQNKIYTFDEDSNEIAVNIEEQEVDGSKPSTYIKGMALETVSFNIILRQSSSIDVETEIDDWKKICASMSACYLFLGNNTVSSYPFLLIGINFSDKKYLGSGKLVQCTMKLTFKEYVRAGVKKEEGTTTSSKKKESKSNKASKKKGSSTSTMSSSDTAKVEALENEIFGG